jgi:hypothetical protein
MRTNLNPSYTYQWHVKLIIFKKNVPRIKRDPVDVEEDYVAESFSALLSKIETYFSDDPDEGYEITSIERGVECLT